MKIKKDKIFLIIIFFLAILLRFWKLSSIPPHLTPDEASLGYNTYSILKTGKDEYGNTLPLIFKSFGDYKPGLYIYLTLPFVAVFGLNEFSVRAVSAVAGVVSVYLIYLIALKLFKNKKVALISSFVAALNPWLIHFSRGAWEVNVSLTLTLLGIYFFLKALTKSKYLIYSALFFALTLVAYQGAKLSTGLVLLILVLIYWKKFFKISTKNLIISALTGFIISLPIFISLFQGKTGRLNVFSIFSYPRPKEYLEAQLSQGNEKVGDLTYVLFHTECFNFTRGILGRWFNHFSGRFLFFEGDWQNPRHTAPNSGVLLLVDFVFLVSGLIFLIKTEKSKEKTFILTWLLLAPLPSILSRDQVHAVRAFNLSIPFVFLISFGICQIHSVISKQKKFKKLILGILGFLYLGSFIYYLDAYFVHLPKHDSRYWEYGYKQIVEIVSPIKGNYEKVKVQQSFAQPYIYFLFYEKYDPQKYQTSAKLVKSEYVGDVGYVEKIDNIYFAPIDWSVNRGESGTLFATDTIRIPYEDSQDDTLFKQIAEIKYLNGRDTAFRIIEVK